MAVTDTFPEYRFRAAAPDRLQWAEWGGERVVFHRPSGKTHLLNEAGWRLLTDVLSEPLSVAQIIGGLAAADADEIDAGFAPRVMALLARFEELGLIERA